MRITTYEIWKFIKSGSHKHLVFSFYYDGAVFTPCIPIESLKECFGKDDDAMTLRKIMKHTNPLCYVKGKSLDQIYLHSEMFLLKIMGGTIQYDMCDMSVDEIKCYFELSGYDYTCQMKDILEGREENE